MLCCLWFEARLYWFEAGLYWFESKPVITNAYDHFSTIRINGAEEELS